ncbi:hypothetical protein ACHQM5_005940 [Ranunculus cassubicifolius]
MSVQKQDVSDASPWIVQYGNNPKSSTFGVWLNLTSVQPLVGTNSVASTVFGGESSDSSTPINSHISSPNVLVPTISIFRVLIFQRKHGFFRVAYVSCIDGCNGGSFFQASRGI